MLKYDVLEVYATSENRAIDIAKNTLDLNNKKNIQIKKVIGAKLENGEGYNVLVTYEE